MYGYIPDIESPEDRVFGSNLTEILQPNMDWTEYLPVYEPQSNDLFDTYGCVTFSAWNTIEIYAKRKYGLTWNKADRFTIIDSGTVPGVGNSARKVLYSIRHNGCPDEEKWPFVSTEKEYYKPIPQNIKDDAIKLLDIAEFEYQILGGSPSSESLCEALKYAPCHVSGHAWDNPINGVYQRSEGMINHMFVLYKADPLKKLFYVYDQYHNDFKTLSWDYNFGWAQQNTFKLKNMAFRTIKGTVKSEVYALIQDKLYQIGSFGSYKKGLEIGMFQPLETLPQQEVDSIEHSPNSIIFSL